MRRIYPSYWLVLFCLTGRTLLAQPDLVLDQIASVASPLDITGAGDNSGRLFIASRAGTVRIFDLNTNSLLGASFLDISSQVATDGEKGLLGLAFHPGFASNGYFYVSFVHSGTGQSRISRFTADPPSSNTVSASTELVIISVPQAPYGNHKGGHIAFGPDGYLYWGLGDGGSSGDPGNRAQDPDELLGKMLRIDVDNPGGSNNYGIPPSNPFVGVQFPTDVRDEIWAFGLRNPWRFSFDRATGDLWIADVGQNAWEEVNYEPAGSPGGANYGWRCYEGNHNYNTSGCQSMSAYDGPVFEYDHGTTGGRSISGGYVYRGSEAPSLQGWYIATDYISDNFWLIQPNGSGWTIDYQPDVAAADIVTFGEDDNGELYAGRLGGAIYKVGATAPLPIELLNFRGDYTEGRVKLNWATATEKDAAYFQVERKTSAGDYQIIGEVPAAGESAFNRAYSFEDASPHAGVNMYRLKMVDVDLSFKYSPAIAVMVDPSASWKLFPNPTTGRLSLALHTPDPAPDLTFEVTDARGDAVFRYEEPAPEPSFFKEFDLEHLPAGMYFYRLEWAGKAAYGKVVVK